MPRTVYENSMIYHEQKPYGKLAVVPTKPLDRREDLALAYSPGVAEPCRAIQRDPLQAAKLTARGNLIAVITNGTAVLGLGNIGPLAAKPVMEGKAVLFKKFAGIDAFDIEIDQSDPDALIDIIAALEPTFGGINLEDIKSPECFYIEKKLSERMNIPVFHDDQHGTAIIVGAALRNALALVGKKIEDIQFVCSGAGAAAIACLDLLISMGLKREHITALDREGVIHSGRTGLDASKQAFVRETNDRTLEDALKNADVFLGLSAANVMNQAMVASMADRPIILALANPDPEVTPDLVKSVRSDAIMATGRSDYPNQVNNALCFPYIFRGALDVGARKITQEMKLACMEAIANLARAESSDIVSSAYGGEIHVFGAEYIIPKPFDPRLYVEVSLAVAKSAMECGVATRPVEDLKLYRQQLSEFVYLSSSVMRSVFEKAKKPSLEPINLVYAEGEQHKVLQAAQMIIDEGMARPILIGRPAVIESRVQQLGLRMLCGQDYDCVDPSQDERFALYWQTYHRLMERRGINPEIAKTLVRTNNTIIGALMLHLGDGDALLCGTYGRYLKHFNFIHDVLGCSSDTRLCASMCVLVVNGKAVFVTDPYLNSHPTAQDLTDITTMAVNQVRHFGLEPKVALLSHSNFGSYPCESAKKMQAVLETMKVRMPNLEIEGEMHADAALSEKIRHRIFPNSRLHGAANLLIAPNVESANIAFNMSKALGKFTVIGPILMGLREVAHILTPSATVRGIFNMSTMAIVDAKERKEKRIS